MQWPAYLNYVITFALALLWVLICYDCSFANALFCSVGAYAAQNTAFQVCHILNELFYEQRSYALSVLFCVVTLAVMGVVSFFAYAKRIKNSIIIENIPLLIISGIILVLVVVCSENIPLRGSLLYRIYAAISGGLALCVQFGIFNESEYKKTEKRMRQLLRLQEKQQALAQQNMDLINIKFHDLKHLAIEDGVNRKMSEEEKREFAALSETYGAIVKTGNSALDIVLTEKSLTAKKNNIQFSTIVDGNALDFISDTDMYALFGNILDNAIDSVMKETDLDKRIISLKVTRHGKFVHIESENYCSQNLKFENGLSQTTKPDKENHGFGMLSIKYLVRRYGGIMDIRLRDCWFKLNILFFIS